MVFLETEHRWECPNCTHTDVTNEALPHSRFHPCRGLRGLTAPMIPAGTKAKIEAHDRDDYVNGEHVQTDVDGRPIMSVTTTRDDGEDCLVFAPTATNGRT